MSFKDLIIDLLNWLFIIGLVIFCIIFFIAKDNMDMVYAVMKSLFPIAVFGIIFLIYFKFKRSIYAKEKKDGVTEYEIRISLYHKFLFECLCFAVPIAVMLIALFVNKTVGIGDILQALVAFGICWWMNNIIFKKQY